MSFNRSRTTVSLVTFLKTSWLIDKSHTSEIQTIRIITPVIIPIKWSNIYNVQAFKKRDDTNLILLILPIVVLFSDKYINERKVGCKYFWDLTGAVIKAIPRDNTPTASDPISCCSKFFFISGNHTLPCYPTPKDSCSVRITNYLKCVTPQYIKWILSSKKRMWMGQNIPFDNG